jgi:hypothetical protein
MRGTLASSAKRDVGVIGQYVQRRARHQPQHAVDRDFELNPRLAPEIGDGGFAGAQVVGGEVTAVFPILHAPVSPELVGDQIGVVTRERV